jgi:methylenetetrahydrofolate dehydrogenase (NADP+)/methenyltetrahydrofolate cyclohydrolase
LVKWIAQKSQKNSKNLNLFSFYGLGTVSKKQDLYMQIIDGKKFAEDLRKNIAIEVNSLKLQTGKTPGLAVILVGEDPASEVYVRNKSKQTVEVGMNNYEYKLPSQTTEAELLKKIDELNKNNDVHGILVQLPLPKHINENAVINAISPEKDVDGFHAINAGKLATNQDGLVPCTPLGCIIMLKHYVGNLEGKNAVVIGKSNIVGRPMAQLLLNEGCTVTVCHSKTANITEFTSKADILVVAVGRPGLVKSDWVKQGAVVIDVGINRIEVDGKVKLTGDVAFEEVAEKTSFITPVPGGVGPMTIACLLKNTLKAFKFQ